LSPRDPVKTNAVAGYEIEFSSQIGQRRLPLDASNDAANVEEIGCAAEERLLVCVKPESFMTEESAEVKKITGAAAEIQNIERWGTIEPKVLRALNVYANPVCRVFVRVDLPGVGPVRITFSQVF